MIYTTLNRIRAHNPCKYSWRKLLATLGKTKADDEPLPYADILRHLSLDDALWCLRCEPRHASLWRHMACDFADTVRHLMTDPRSHEAIRIARLYADGNATNKELAVARAAAARAAGATAWAARAAGTTAWAARAARVAAWGAAVAAGNAAQRACTAIFLHRVSGDTPIYAWGSCVRVEWRAAA
jgi:hypothetical protein